MKNCWRNSRKNTCYWFNRGEMRRTHRFTCIFKMAANCATVPVCVRGTCPWRSIKSLFSCEWSANTHTRAKIYQTVRIREWIKRKHFRRCAANEIRNKRRRRWVNEIANKISIHSHTSTLYTCLYARANIVIDVQFKHANYQVEKDSLYIFASLLFYWITLSQ